MAFRQHNKAPQTEWRKKHRDELLRNGLPESVVDDERQWNYVLGHGADEFGTGWDTSWITRDQARRLLALLESHYTNPTGLDLIRALQTKIHANDE
jgi:hypothetical protein